MAKGHTETYLQLTEQATGRYKDRVFEDLPAFVRPAFTETSFNAPFCYAAWIRGMSAAELELLRDIEIDHMAT